MPIEGRQIENYSPLGRILLGNREQGTLKGDAIRTTNRPCLQQLMDEIQKDWGWSLMKEAKWGGRGRPLPTQTVLHDSMGPSVPRPGPMEMAQSTADPHVLKMGGLSR